MRPDIAAAWAKVNNKMGKKRDVRKLPEYFNADEHVLVMAGGKIGNNLGLLVATNRRALFVSEGVVNHSFEDFPYNRITSVTSARGMMLGKILIHTGGAARVVENVAKSEAEAVAAAIRDRVEASTRERQTMVVQQVSPQQTQPPQNLAGELRELAELRDQGILTDAEFEQQKARLLGG